MGVVIVTGTGTRVGKTTTCAAVAACATGTVAYVKLAQTGLADGEVNPVAGMKHEATQCARHGCEVCSGDGELQRDLDARTPDMGGLSRAA